LTTIIFFGPEQLEVSMRAADLARLYPFLFGGPQVDLILLLDDKRQSLERQLEIPGAEETETTDRLIAIEDRILASVPTSAAAAAVQLRLFGAFAEDFEWSDWHQGIVGNVIAGLEQIT
jgi:hypothetical protein